MVDERALLGHGNTVQLLEVQAQLTDKLWFQQFLGILMVFTTGLCAYDGYIGIGTHCEAGGVDDLNLLALVLLIKASLFFIVGVMQIVVTQLYRKHRTQTSTQISIFVVTQNDLEPGPMRTNLKRLMQFQQVLSVMNMLATCVGFYIASEVLGFHKFLTWQFGEGAVFQGGIFHAKSAADEKEVVAHDCGNKALSGMSWFVEFWIIFPIVFGYVLNGNPKAKDVILSVLHFLPL